MHAISMTDFINNVNNNSTVNINNDNQKQYIENSTIAQKQDTVELNNNKNINKNKKKKIIIVASSIVAIALAFLAFFKRKQIGGALSNLFKKKKPTEPITPISENIPNHKMQPIAQLAKPTQEAASKMQSDIDATKLTEQVNQGIQKNVEKIGKEIPIPTFGNNPTIEERKQYLESIAMYIKNEDSGLVNQAIDAIRKYGTAEDIDKLHTTAWVFADEPTLVNLVKTVAKLGRLDKGDDMKVTHYITAKNHDLSNETYIEIFKALNKLVSEYGSRYEGLVRFLNKVPDDKDGEFTRVLTETLINLGNKASVKYLDRYETGYSLINDFISKGEETPQVVLDIIEKIRKAIEKK